MSKKFQILFAIILYTLFSICLPMFSMAEGTTQVYDPTNVLTDKEMSIISNTVDIAEENINCDLIILISDSSEDIEIEEYTDSKKAILINYNTSENEFSYLMKGSLAKRRNKEELNNCFSTAYEALLAGENLPTVLCQIVNSFSENYVPLMILITFYFLIAALIIVILFGCSSMLIF